MTSPTGTVLYDGDCGFCTWCADWLAIRSAVTTQPWQGVEDRLPELGLTLDDVSSRVYWLDGQPDDARVAASGARAVAAALRACSGAWPLLGVVVDLPPVRPLAAVAYRLVAANRHRLPGSTCAVGPVVR